MVVFINTSTGWGGILDLVGNFTLGDPELLGVWLLLLMIGFSFVFRLDIKLMLILMVPLIIVTMATGFMKPIVGGIVLLVVGFMLAAHFIFR